MNRKKKMPELKQEKKSQKYNKIRDWVKNCMPEVNNVSYPNEGDPEVCKARVEKGMECWCRDRCSCRTCQEKNGTTCKDAKYDCPEACKKCSEYQKCF